MITLSVGNDSTLTTSSTHSSLFLWDWYFRRHPYPRKHIPITHPTIPPQIAVPLLVGGDDCGEDVEYLDWVVGMVVTVVVLLSTRVKFLVLVWLMVWLEVLMMFFREGNKHD